MASWRHLIENLSWSKGSRKGENSLWMVLNILSRRLIHCRRLNTGSCGGTWGVGVGDRPGEDIETNQIQFFSFWWVGDGNKTRRRRRRKESVKNDDEPLRLTLDREHVISSLFFVRFFARGVCKLALDISYYNISSSTKSIQALMSDQNMTETRQRR